MDSGAENPEIFKDSFWARPLPRAKGAVDCKLLYQAVGEALSQWEHVDQRLANLFAIFACTPDTDAYTRHAVTRAYGSIIGTANRRSTIEAAAEAYFPEWIKNGEPIRKELTRILNAAGLAAKRRDEI